jgi:hypothetical protein
VSGETLLEHNGKMTAERESILSFEGLSQEGGWSEDEDAHGDGVARIRGEFTSLRIVRRASSSSRICPSELG